MRALFASVLLFASTAGAQARCATDGVLPAGVYWADIGWYEHRLACPRPAVALVEGVYPGAGAARRALRRQRGIALAPGYPWVVHTRYAGIEGDGVAVVLGLFASADAARAWSRSHRGSRAVELRAVMTPQQALERHAIDHGGAHPDPIPLVTHVVGPEPVAAHGGTDLEAVERGERAAVACRVQPGEVFVFPRDPRAGPGFLGEHHRWRPVRCGARLAWIAVEHTTATAVTWSDDAGAAYVTQVTGVECDVPTHTTWTIDEQWRRGAPSTDGGSCGAP